MSAATAIAIESADPWILPAKEKIAASMRSIDKLILLPDRATRSDAYREMMSAVDVVVGYPNAEWVRDSAVRLLMLTSTGVDAYIGHGLGHKPDLSVCNAHGVFTIGLAEHALWLMLSGTRMAGRFMRSQLEQGWARTKLGYGELNDSTVCILGMGLAGSALATRCAAMGMRVIGVRRRSGEPPPGVERVVAVHELEDWLPQTDHLVIILPGGQETQNLIGTRQLSLLKKGAWVYNIGRGSTLDQAALLSALKSGHLGGAGLDVFAREPLPADNDLWKLPNVILTPHVAGFSDRDRERFGDLVVANYRRFCDGQPLLNLVDRRQLDP